LCLQLAALVRFTYAFLHVVHVVHVVRAVCVCVCVVCVSCVRARCVVC
jgi:hypothetical protein